MPIQENINQIRSCVYAKPVNSRSQPPKARVPCWLHTWDTGEDNDPCFLVVGDSSYVGNTASLQYGVYVTVACFGNSEFFNTFLKCPGIGSCFMLSSRLFQLLTVAGKNDL